jgi:hypothetical protein
MDGGEAMTENIAGITTGFVYEVYADNFFQPGLDDHPPDAISWLHDPNRFYLIRWEGE